MGFCVHQTEQLPSFDVPRDKCGTDPWSMNRKVVITGNFGDEKCNFHGFVRASDGSITTFDVPKSTETTPLAISDKGAIAGFYNVCNSGCEELHGYVRNKNGKFTKFDPHKSMQTIPESVNGVGDIAGSFKGTRYRSPTVLFGRNTEQSRSSIRQVQIRHSRSASTTLVRLPDIILKAVLLTVLYGSEAVGTRQLIPMAQVLLLYLRSTT